MPLIPTLRGKSRQISEFEVSLVYRVGSRPGRDIQRNLVSKRKTKNQTKPTNQPTKKFRNTLNIVKSFVQKLELEWLLPRWPTESAYLGCL